MENKPSRNFVCCEVENCKYHSTDCRCHADSITVQSPAAMRKGETFCGTFAPKTGHKA